MSNSNTSEAVEIKMEGLVYDYNLHCFVIDTVQAELFKENWPRKPGSKGGFVGEADLTVRLEVNSGLEFSKLRSK